MITVTNNAKDKLMEILLVNTDDREIGLRLTMEPPGQFGLALDKGLPTDEVVEHEGLKLLFIEPELVGLLEGATLDAQDTPEGSKLVVFRE